MPNLSRGKFAAVLSAAFFVAAVIVKAKLPLLEWDVFYFDVAKRWSLGSFVSGPMDHPPLYLLYLTLPFQFFGAMPETARIFNIFPVLAAAAMIYLTARNISGRNSGLIAACLFLINPVTIQGVQSLDSSDSTLLPLCFALVSYFLSRACVETGRSALVLGALLTLSFWAKATSSIALIAGVIVYLFVFRGRMEKKFRSLLTSGISWGVLFFIFTWSAACFLLGDRESWALVLEIPFIYFSQSRTSFNGAGIFKWALDLIRIIFWFSPFLLYLAYSGIKKVFMREVSQPAAHLMAFLCVFYFAGYLFIGGSNYGFPRYHAAISPLLHVFAGIALVQIAGGFSAAPLVYLIVPAALCSALTVIYVDPELLINLILKQLLFYGNYLAIVNKVLLPLFCYTALPLAVALLLNKWRGSKVSKATFAAAASAALLGTCAGLYVRQISAGYSTSYQYGAFGRTEVLKEVSAKLSGGETIMATPEFICDFVARNVAGSGWRVWQSEKEMYNFISQRKPAFIIAGWTTHTQAQLKWLLKDREIRGILEKCYVLSEIGTYFVWESRSGRKALDSAGN
ncbi:MAG: glycosyltransferase family 39 protein [Elusimicrobiales bacterium]|nr:glycosyltransferase family 39 protein [Elusimicrobiales bacterium]